MNTYLLSSCMCMSFEEMYSALGSRIDCELCVIFLHFYSRNELELVNNDEFFKHDSSQELNINGTISDDDFQ